MTSSLSEGRFRQAEFWRTVYAINPEAGTTVEEMLEEKFWAHVSRSLKPWDLIEARAEDGSFYAVFLVRDAGRTWAKVSLIQAVQLEPDAEKADGGTKDYISKWTGPHTKWRVVRVADKSTMKENFADKESANKWIVEHEKAIGK